MIDPIPSSTFKLVGQHQLGDRDHHPHEALAFQIQQRTVAHQVQEAEELRRIAPAGDRHPRDLPRRQPPGHFLLIARELPPGRGGGPLARPARPVLRGPPPHPPPLPLHAPPERPGAPTAALPRRRPPRTMVRLPSADPRHCGGDADLSREALCCKAPSDPAR